MADDNLAPKSARSHGNGNRNINIHVSPEELTIYHSLPPEKKKLIRMIVKTLLSNPELLDVMNFWQNFVLRKAFSAYVCPVCLMPFTTYRALMNHLRYTSHPLKCAVCGFTANSQDALYDHFRKKHLGL